MSHDQATPSAPHSEPDTPALEYLGETRVRSPRVAVALTLLSPGLGFMYLGELTRGLTINLGFVMLLEAFIILQASLKFFPLVPLLVITLAWWVFTLLAALDVRRRAAALFERDEEYVLKPYNHWLPYALVAVFTLYAPIGISADVVMRYVWRTVRMDHSGMYPTLLRGETLLVERAGYAGTRPKSGELVVVSKNDEGTVFHVLRSIGDPGDIVRVDGDMVTVNGDPATHTELQAEEIRVPIPKHDQLMPVVERVDGAEHVVSIARRGVDHASVSQMKLGEKGLLLLADNRAQASLTSDEATIRDSRNFGFVSTDKVRGKPRYILWSVDPKTGVRWDRIGLRLR